MCHYVVLQSFFHKREYQNYLWIINVASTLWSFFFFACQRIIPTSFQQFLVNFPTFWNCSSTENKLYMYIWISHGLRCFPFSMKYFCHFGQLHMTSHLVVVVEASWWWPLCMYLQGLIHLRLGRTLCIKCGGECCLRCLWTTQSPTHHSV